MRGSSFRLAPVGPGSGLSAHAWVTAPQRFRSAHRFRSVRVRRLNSPRRAATVRRSKPAVRVIRVWAIWISRSRGIRVVRIVVWCGGSGSGSADDGTRRDTGGDATPTWAIIAAAVATADVDVAVDVNIAIDVGAVEIPAVNIGTV